LLIPVLLIFVCLGLVSATGTATALKPVANPEAAPVPQVTADPVIMRFDEGIAVTWNVPVTGFNYRLPEGMQSRLYMNADGRTGVIRIVNYEQGQNFNLEIVGALGVNGRTMAPGKYVQPVTTPLALKVDITPASGQNRVPNMNEIIFNFGEEVSNPEAFEKSFSISPPTVGLFTWISANQAKFTPKVKWPYDTTVRVVLKGGPGSLAGLRGNYIDRDIVDEFTTMPQKMIDLNLSDQKLYCYEEGNLVYSCWVASGKSGYSTRTGDFRIYAKDRSVDMTSSPGDAEFYNVPNVPYVNWFSGGQAIHGCYWSSEFGYPRSHGCVNVTVSDAAWIYDWAPVGTPVFSHY
jgi:hypothetical protein